MRGAAPSDSWYLDVSNTFVAHRLVSDEATDFRAGSIDRAKAKYINEDETAVVYEVLNCFAREAEVRVCKLGNLRYAVDAVDVRQYARKCEV